MICNKCNINEASSFQFCIPCKRILDNDKYKNCLSCNIKIDKAKHYNNCYKCNIKKKLSFIKCTKCNILFDSKNDLYKSCYKCNILSKSKNDENDNNNMFDD